MIISPEDESELESLLKSKFGGKRVKKKVAKSPEVSTQESINQVPVESTEVEVGTVEEVKLETGTETPVEDATQVEQSRALFVIFSQKCLKCQSLVGLLDDAEDYTTAKCHFTNGGDNCPAATTRVVIGVNVPKTVQKIKVAMDSGDLATVNKVLSRLEKKDPVIRSQVLNALKECFAS